MFGPSIPSMQRSSPVTNNSQNRLNILGIIVILMILAIGVSLVYLFTYQNLLVPVALLFWSFLYASSVMFLTGSEEKISSIHLVVTFFLLSILIYLLLGALLWVGTSIAFLVFTAVALFEIIRRLVKVVFPKPS